ncbi:hypothetical protein [Evansella tamaricis]|uniref:Uncharacterized protein n=1 Tax=Evansella tamaricis TaxID=2069301 RepID=A0ABS6JFS7_9BACI|nr:hypothetical protein [Evansella tamaricis]MBU9712260.1 hypothetical protein [Evansella tamaricis]
MSVLPKLSVNYKKEYVIKTNECKSSILHPEHFLNFQDGNNSEIAWKWLNLPIRSDGKILNKLVIQNMTKEFLHINLLVRFTIDSDSDCPLVYYSPSREALISYDGTGYSLFGGIGNRREAVNYSTIHVDVEQWEKGLPLNFQPLSKHSEGWGMEFELQLPKNATCFIYEWEFKSSKLHELEDLHSQYQCLLGNQTFSNT